MNAVELLKTFDEAHLPDLDAVTLGALELFASEPPPSLDIPTFNHPLVVGSGNAQVTGRILFERKDAVFADESTYLRKLDAVRSIDGAILISASGSKHAGLIAQELKKRSIPTWLLTNNPEAPAKAFVEANNVRVFPRNREPYTYNTSTYMGMLLSGGKEDPKEILSFLEQDTAKRIPDTFGDYNAFFLLVPAAFDAVREMFLTKFDELFGPLVSKRVFTPEQTKHAKTVVPSEKELFVSFGEKNASFGKGKSLFIPLPEHAGSASVMAVGYYVIGHIQKQLPPYFKEHILAYTEEASRLFGNSITPIVE